jgi:shikimate kinase
VLLSGGAGIWRKNGVKNIYLVGFMGTGKTAVGQELARRKKQQFLDLDALIELKEKRSIADIFAQEGEPYFRRRETQALKEVAKEKGFVVATGGGIMINPDNIKVMRESGVIVCLTAAPAVILKRTQGATHRPLLNVKDPKKQIGLLLKLRAPYYAQADITIDTSRLCIDEIAKKILKLKEKK